MRFRDGAAASWRRILVSSLLWTGAVLAKSDTPTMSVKTLDNPPSALKYFPGSDDVLFHDSVEKTIHRSDDAGASWQKVDPVPDAHLLVMHDFDPHRAYVLGDGNKHFYTEDNGKSWKKFDSLAKASAFRDGEVLRFHADDPDRILFNGMLCKGIFCEEVTTYTTDGFSTPVDELMRHDTSGCWWAKSSPEFTTGDEDLDKNRIICIVRDSISRFKEDQRLVVSDDYFRKEEGKIKEFEPPMVSSKSVLGVTDIAVAKRFMLVAAAAPKTDEMALYVTTDAINWHRANFPQSHGHTLNQGAYTVLESTNYSLQIDVMNTQPSNPMGVMFTSNSEGTYFIENLEHTNRDDRGLVDFEKITGIQGIFLLNKVENGEEVEKDHHEKKKIVTEITFDDGRTFEEVKAGDERIHLHSITDMNNIGRVFSGPAPGLVVGNGNTGGYLKGMEKADLYVSDNAGVNWRKALDGPHKYVVGDQGSIIVAVKDSLEEDVSDFSYSLDHGEKWKKVSFPDDLSVRPIWFTTSQDSTTLEFLFLGKRGKKYVMVSIDFDSLHERTCGKDDMETWHARVDSDNEPTCLMGHKQTFQRRKKDAKCFIRKEFKKPVAETEDCECSDQDFECDFNFVRDGEGECKPDGPLIDSDGACKNAKPDDTFKGSSGWRLIPGNTCKRTGKSQKDDLVERKCSDVGGSRPPQGDGEIGHHQFVFKSKYKDFEKYYLEKGDASHQSGETVIVRPVEYSGTGMTPEDKIWRTADHGKTWERILEDKGIAGIYQHPSYNEVMFFTTKKNKVYYTVDRGARFHSFKAPGIPVRTAYPFSFHPNKKDWMIILVEVCDDDGDNCNTEAHVSRNRGDKWTRIVRHAIKCEFTGSQAYNWRPLKQIVCLGTAEDEVEKGRQLFVSNDFFDEHVVHPAIRLGDSDKEAQIQSLATMSEFIVAAVAEEGEEGMLLFASIDGENFARAKFPANFKTDHSVEFTVLDSSTHAINMFVPTETRGDGCHVGNILKSNSNGTSYVLSASGVNCDEMFYVDFDRIPGLEGVSVINTVANSGKADEGKKLQTKITHSDGAEWFHLKPPKEDADGKAFSCSSDRGDSSCALHLHGYTQRTLKRKGYAAATAVGLMFGVGNVGAHLEGLDKADTYMTADGGMTWRQVQKGVWTWQYGDQGSLTVLVKQWRKDNKVETNHVLYSTDEGTTWNKYEFAKDEMAVYDITSQRAGSSRNFILWCLDDAGDVVGINIDFTALASEPCGEDDYYTWTPKNRAGEDDCLFGHKSKYMRKMTDRQCYNDGRVKHDRLAETCACDRSDFECAYNFELNSSGQCTLVPGLSPLSAEEWCSRNPDAVEYFEPTGYRRIPLTTCSGGATLDEALYSAPCTGHEEEYERRHRVSGVAIFFAVTVPFGLAAAVGWYVWRNWHTQFGQIRLGEGGGGGGGFGGWGGGLDSEAPWVRYPVIALSAVVALVAAMPLVATSLWRTATGAYARVRSGGVGGGRRFTTRDSFARSYGDYAGVDDVEGELLGDDSDEEV